MIATWMRWRSALPTSIPRGRGLPMRSGLRPLKHCAGLFLGSENRQHDPFMFPFDNQKLAINPDRVVYFPIQEKALHRYLQQAGLSKLPVDFAGYEAAMHRVLEQDKQQGAVALKFEAPYFRSLVNIADPPREQVEAIYN